MRSPVLLLVGLLLLGCSHQSAPSLVPVPPREQIVGRLVLLGDGGHPADAGDEPVLVAARALLTPFADAGTLVLLGDNIYPRGLPPATDPEYPEMRRRLLAQVDAGLEAGAEVVAVPGNHDWAKSGEDGWARVQAQAQLLRAHSPRAQLLPADACPGPVAHASRSGIRLLALDTQWFLHPKAKPFETCQVRDLAAVGAAVRSALQSDTTATLVIAHHPLRSFGVHGGYYTWQDHLFPLRALNKSLWIPLPVLGTAYPVVRGAGVSAQDLPNSTNRALADTVRAALGDGGALAYANGHEHNLQVIEDGEAGLLLVSGAGYFGHESALIGGEDLRFGTPKGGGMIVDRLADGRIRLGVFTVDRAGAAREVYSRWLR